VLRQLLAMAEVHPSAVTGAIVASVVPTLTEPMVALVKRAFGKDALVVGPGIRSGMPILYENPKEVGADRIVNAVAAYERVKNACIIVDFGTATTFDCVSPKGEYLGGVISPGVNISADALFARAAKLPRVEIAKPPKVVGRNTVHSMQSGIVYGYVGLVDGLIDRLVDELGYPCKIIATGGIAKVIGPLSARIEEVDDELTLVGLRILYERNVSPES
jgi:type III pantothenate kinase